MIQKKKSKYKPASIFRAKLNIITPQTPSKLDHVPSYLNHLLLTLPQLVLHMNWTCSNKSMNPRPLGVLHSLPSRPNIVLTAPREAANDRNMPLSIDRIANLLGDHLNGLKVVFRGGWEASLDNVYAELGELAGNVELLLGGEGGPRGLLSVAESGIEDANIVGVGYTVRNVLRTPHLRRSGRLTVGALAGDDLGFFVKATGIELERGSSKSLGFGMEERMSSVMVEMFLGGGVGGGGDYAGEFGVGENSGRHGWNRRRRRKWRRVLGESEDRDGEMVEWRLSRSIRNLHICSQGV